MTDRAELADALAQNFFWLVLPAALIVFIALNGRRNR